MNEVAVGSGGFFGIQGEGIFTVFGLAGVKAEVVPVTGGNGVLFFLLAYAHTTTDTVVDAGCISNDDGRTVIAFGFVEGL